jgi:hypothetical protein
VHELVSVKDLGGIVKVGGGVPVTTEVVVPGALCHKSTKNFMHIQSGERTIAPYAVSRASGEIGTLRVETGVPSAETKTALVLDMDPEDTKHTIDRSGL